MDWCMCYVMLHHLQLEAAQVSESCQRDFWFVLLFLFHVQMGKSSEKLYPWASLQVVQRKIFLGSIVEYQKINWQNEKFLQFSNHDPMQQLEDLNLMIQVISNGFCPRAQVLMACSFSPTGIIALSSTIIRLT